MVDGYRLFDSSFTLLAGNNPRHALPASPIAAVLAANPPGPNFSGALEGGDASLTGGVVVIRKSPRSLSAPMAAGEVYIIG